MIVVADTTPIRYLILIDQVELLPRLFGEIVLPSRVLDELMHQRVPAKVREWATNLPNWIDTRSPLEQGPYTGLDPGEDEAIRLALELKADLLLVDEKPARVFAQTAGIRFTGTLGVLRLAFERNWVEPQPTLNKLRLTNFYLSDRLVQEILGDLEKAKRDRIK